MVGARTVDPADHRLHRPGASSGSPRPDRVERRPEPRGRAGRDAAPRRHAATSRCCARSGPTCEEVDGGARMIVPVTDRGDAIGLLEMDLPRHPSAEEIADISSAAHALAYVVIAARRHTDVFEWGQRSTPFALAAEIQRRLLPGLLHLRGRASSPSPAGWSRPAPSAGTRSTTRWTATACRSRSPTPSATRWRRRCWPPCSSAACATAAARASTSARRPPTPTTRSPRTPRPASSSPVS